VQTSLPDQSHAKSEPVAPIKDSFATATHCCLAAPAVWINHTAIKNLIESLGARAGTAKNQEVSGL
jgi:hypothetical protein